MRSLAMTEGWYTFLMTKWQVALLVLVVNTLFLGGWWLFGPKTATEIDGALVRGAQYVGTHYRNFQYDDPYLQYRYPGEQLSCPVVGCDVTYRTLDAFFMLTFLARQGFQNPAVERQYRDGEATLAALRPLWKEGPISNTTASKGEGYALDSFCILGYVRKDAAFAKTALANLDASGNWMADDFYAQDLWRNTADESWCLRLLAVTGEGSDRLPTLTEKFLKDVTEDTLNITNPLTGSESIAVLYHALAVVRELPSDLATKHEGEINTFRVQFIGNAEHTLFTSNALLVANALETLAADRTDSDLQLELVRWLLDHQQKGGFWEAVPGEENGRVFTTLRAMIALATYRNAR